MSENRSFWTELQRRHVVRAALGHVVFFWLLVQVADVVLPYVGIVEQPVRWAIVAGVALFPITLIVAWLFEHPWHRYTSARLFVDIAFILGIGFIVFAWVVQNIPKVVHARTSIVILPFDYDEGSALGQSLSRALALEVNSLLMKSRSIDVVGYESASSSLLEGLDIEAIKDTLGVQHVLSGVIRMADASMNVSVHLYGEDKGELWSAELEDELDNLYALQERIAEGVQQRLGETGVGETVADVAATRCPMPTDPSALERYYTARHYTESRTDGEISNQQLAEAVEIYENLIKQYPNFAQAYSGLAWARTYQSTYDPAFRDQAGELRHRVAPALAQQALEYCPNLGEALVQVGNEADHPNVWINEEQNFALWLDLQPESTEATEKYTQHLRRVGRHIEALELAERNYRLNPLSTQAIKLLVFSYIHEQRWEEAVALERRVHELGSTVPPFASTNKARADCGDDLECFLANLDPPFQPFIDQLRIVYTPPANEEEAENAIETAFQLNEMAGGNALNWFNGSACHYDHLTPLFFRLWDRYWEMREARWYWHWPNAWGIGCGNVWEHERFPAILEKEGMVEYFRAKAWADPCRPEGDSFVCSEQIWRKKRTTAGLLSDSK